MKMIKILAALLAFLMLATATASCGGGVDTTAPVDTTKVPDDPTTNPDTTKVPDDPTTNPDTTKAPTPTTNPDTTKAPAPTTKPDTTKTPDPGKTPEIAIPVDTSKATLTPGPATVMNAWSASYALSALLDGDTKTRFAAKYVGKDGATGTVEDYWFVIDFGKEVTFDHVLDYDYDPTRWDKWVFATSKDGKTWSEIAENKVTASAPTPVPDVSKTYQVEFVLSEAVTTRYLKIQAIHTAAALNSGGFSLWELSFSKGSLLSGEVAETLGEGYFAVADVTPVATGLVADYGQPAMIDPGSAYPALKIATYKAVTDAKITILKGDKTVKTQSLGALEAGKIETYPIDGKVSETGEYRILLSLTSGGKNYEYIRYFTVIDTKQFGNGNVALAYKGADGKLVYVRDYMGNYMLDYSRVGYLEGAALPTADYIAKLPKVTIKPVSGDNGAAIQAAINSMRTKPLNAEGYRGVVELEAGTYNCTTEFNLNVSGVILRGATGKEGDVIIVGQKGMTLRNSGSGSFNVQSATETSVQGSYLPAGETRIPVANASAFKVGDQVVVIKKITAEWISYLGMDKLVRNGSPQTWNSVGTEMRHERVIVAIEGNVLVLDTGVSDSFDAKYLGYPVARVAKCSRSGGITHTGIEALTIKYASLSMDHNQNSWLRNMTVDLCTQSNGNVGNSIVMESNSKYITLKDCTVVHMRNDQTAAPADFTMKGTYLLLDGCVAPMYNQGNTWGYVYHARNAGPHVVYNSVGAACPHQRWTTGILIDTVKIPTTSTSRPGVQFINRHTMGSGHGWTCGWSVAWNCEAGHFKFEAAPGTTNWGIGCVGSKVTASYRAGLYFSHGTKITLGSLYAAQLAERTAK